MAAKSRLQKKEKIMKRNLMVLSLIGVLSATAAQTWAAGNDAIAASPKVRQTLNEQNGTVAATTAAPVVACCPCPADAIAASPKVSQMLRESTGACCVASQPVIAGYKASSDYGIAASPKVRQILDEQSSRVQIAPLK